METITASPETPRRRAARKDTDFLLYKLVVGSVAIALLALGVPRIGASTLQSYVDSAMGAATSQEVATAHIRLLETADDWFGDPLARMRAGWYALRLAYAPDAPPGLARRRLEQAVSDLSQGLARAPANPSAWTALADARLAMGNKRGAAAALKTSIKLGPYETELILPRCQLGLRLWPGLDSDGQQAVASQFRLAWGREPAALVALVKHEGNVFPVMISLARDPEQLTKFMTALAAGR